MGRLIYSAITSLDGFTNDADGNFDWSAPDPQVHQFVNDAERSIGTYLYGRRIYDVMAYWADPPAADLEHKVIRDYAGIWQSADKVVFSTSLTDARTPRTRIEKIFDPHVIRSLVSEADTDVSIGGPTLAAQALRAGLVHEIHQYISPVIVGAGTHFLPSDLRLDLELIDERRFDNGVVYAAYSILT